MSCEVCGNDADGSARFMENNFLVCGPCAGVLERRETKKILSLESVPWVVLCLIFMVCLFLPVVVTGWPLLQILSGVLAGFSGLLIVIKAVPLFS